MLKIAGAAGLAAIGRPIVSGQTIAQPIFTSYPFTLGVASGDPLPDGIVLWTRLAPAPLEDGGMPMTNVEVRWEIAADSRFAKVVRNGAHIARPELGHTVHVEASGLEAGRDYWYRFRAGNEVSQTGLYCVRRRPSARQRTVCVLRYAVAATTRPDIFPHIDISRTSTSTSSSTPATTSTRGGPTVAAIPTSFGSITGRSCTPSSTTGPDTRNTNPIRI